MKFFVERRFGPDGFCRRGAGPLGRSVCHVGETVEGRQENILKNSFLKESLQNRDYNAAAGFFNELVAKFPSAAESILPARRADPTSTSSPRQDARQSRCRLSTR